MRRQMRTGLNKPQRQCASLSPVVGLQAEGRCGRKAAADAHNEPLCEDEPVILARVADR